jgi:hypothetical protein
MRSEAYFVYLHWLWRVRKGGKIVK